MHAFGAAFMSSEPYQGLSDQQLVAAVNAGDKEAFAPLYYRHRDWVLRLAYRFTGNHADSLDVLQDTFAYLAGKFPDFQLTAAMTTFLYPAVRNLSIAANKRRLRSTGGDEALAFIESHDVGDHSANANDVVPLLAGLSADHREILLMRFVDDLTQPEIACALNIPLGTVKSRLHLAIAALKASPVARRLLDD